MGRRLSQAGTRVSQRFAILTLLYQLRCRGDEMVGLNGADARPPGRQHDIHEPHALDAAVIPDDAEKDRGNGNTDQ